MAGVAGIYNNRVKGRVPVCSGHVEISCGSVKKRDFIVAHRWMCSSEELF